MVRTLPWLNPGRSSTKTATTTSARQERIPTKRKRNDATTDSPNSTGVSTPHRRPHHRSSSRTPSTSPPPAPPLQEPMRPADDAWIMVEDELYAVAQLFTQHLHHAEYQRLKGVAARRSVDLATITRPVDQRAVLSEEARLRKRQEGKRKEVAEAVERAEFKVKEDEESEGPEEDDVVIGDRNLAGLMMGTGGRRGVGRKMLKGNAKASNTRAAAGFEKQKWVASRLQSNDRIYDIPGLKTEETLQQKEVPNSAVDEAQNGTDPDDDDDDDLDGPVRKIPRTIATSAQHRLPSMAVASVPAPLRDKTNSTKQHTGPLAAKPASRPLAAAKEATVVTEDFVKKESKTFAFEDFPKSRAVTSGLISRTRISEARKEKQRQTIKLEEIPTFLV